MKDTEKKLAFVKARAEGKSYSMIASELQISKSTCTKWERALRAEISACKEEKLQELYSTYKMAKEARIKALGDTIEKLDSAIDQKGLEEVPVEKLLELRLKYGRALKEEYTEPMVEAGEDSEKGILEQYNKLYVASQSGEYTPAQIKAQLAILDAKRQSLNLLEAQAMFAPAKL